MLNWVFTEYLQLFKIFYSYLMSYMHDNETDVGC